MLSFPQELLEEEPVAMATGADEEEGAISDPGTEIVDRADERLKVHEKYMYKVYLLHTCTCVNVCSTVLYSENYFRAEQQAGTKEILAPICRVMF